LRSLRPRAALLASPTNPPPDLLVDPGRLRLPPHGARGEGVHGRVRQGRRRPAFAGRGEGYAELQERVQVQAEAEEGAALHGPVQGQGKVLPG
jgi:hypothetical protein